MIKGQVVRSIVDRVWDKVAFPQDDMVHDCWLWTGAKSKKRSRRRGVQYRPVVQLAGRGSRIVNVARLILEWYAGPPPSPDHEAGHTCPAGETELCVSPFHLVWMTRLENERFKQSYP